MFTGSVLCKIRQFHSLNVFYISKVYLHFIKNNLSWFWSFCILLPVLYTGTLLPVLYKLPNQKGNLCSNSISIFAMSSIRDPDVPIFRNFTWLFFPSVPDLHYLFWWNQKLNLCLIQSPFYYLKCNKTSPSHKPILFRNHCNEWII